MKSIHDLLEIAIERQASDLILKAGCRPVLRVDGLLEGCDLPVLAPQDTRSFILSIIDSSGRDHLLAAQDEGRGQPILTGAEGERRMALLEAGEEVDLVFTIAGMARVRANLFLERGHFGATLRIIPLSPYTLDELRLPPVLREMAMLPQGLVLITGPTGSGKTTTMAALIEEINRRRSANVFTIEEPVEYVFTDRRSVIHQREVGTDTKSFASALRSVMRQSPDVIVIGEMRDAETMDVAMSASEIGHLVIATLHTVSAPGTIDRILNSFSPHLRDQVSAQFAASMVCVTSQRLVRLNGGGRAPAVEVLTNSPTVRKLIDAGETSELYAAMRDGRHYGMNTLNQALERFVALGEITEQEAVQAAGNPTELRQMLRKA